MDFSTILGFVPESCALYVALFIIACKILTVFIRPPATGSRWVTAYQLVSLIALNVGWATNRLTAGHVKPKPD